MRTYVWTHMWMFLKLYLLFLLLNVDFCWNMINKINKERRRSMNATPIWPSNMNQWQEARADPKQKQGRAQVSTHSLITKWWIICNLNDNLKPDLGRLSSTVNKNANSNWAWNIFKLYLWTSSWIFFPPLFPILECRLIWYDYLVK
jgi:hypothetical protein